MLPGRNGAGGFVGHPRELAGWEGAEDGAVGVGQGRQHRLAAGEAGAIGAAVGGGLHQFRLATVPLIQQLLGRGAADQARVGDAGETHTGNVAGGGVDALQIPDGFGGLGVVIGEEATAVLLGEDARESPFIALQGADIKNVDHQDVAGLGPIDPDRSTQDVNNLQIDIFDVFGVVVVLDLAIGPVLAFDPEHITRIHRGHGRNLGMPAVMPGHVLLIHRLGEIDGEEGFWHRETEAQFPHHPKG